MVIGNLGGRCWLVCRSRMRRAAGGLAQRFVECGRGLAAAGRGVLFGCSVRGDPHPAHATASGPRIAAQAPSVGASVLSVLKESRDLAGHGGQCGVAGSFFCVWRTVGGAPFLTARCMAWSRTAVRIQHICRCMRCQRVCRGLPADRRPRSDRLEQRKPVCRVASPHPAWPSPGVLGDRHDRAGGRVHGAVCADGRLSRLRVVLTWACAGR